MFEYVNESKANARIMVIGVGGAGGNAVIHMIENNLQDVDFISMNTDKQALKRCNHRTLQIGQELTKGFGAGSDPEIGKKAAEEDVDRIKKLLEDVDMLFISAGMGGGTGTGASSVIAKIAKTMDILTVAVVTTPFNYEGEARFTIANKGLQELEHEADSIIVVPNEKLTLVCGGDTTVIEAMKKADNVLLGAIKGISELVTKTGFMNCDFADLVAVMSVPGRAIMAIGTAEGEDRARKAVETALNCPLLEDVSLDQAGGILINVTSDDSLTLNELNTINETARKISRSDVGIKPGHVLDSTMNGVVKVSVIITGLKTSQYLDKKDQELKENDEDISQATTIEYEDKQPEPQTQSKEEFDLAHPKEDSTTEKKYMYPLNHTKERNEKKFIMDSEENNNEKIDYNKPAFIRRQAN